MPPSRGAGSGAGGAVVVEHGGMAARRVAQPPQRLCDDAAHPTKGVLPSFASTRPHGPLAITHL